MIEYQVHISVNKFNDKNNKYEFHWMGDELRSPRKDFDLLIKGENEEDVYETVLKQSKDTLTIIEIFIPKESTLKKVKENKTKLEDFSKQYIELCIPLRNIDIISIIANNPATVGNN